MVKKIPLAIDLLGSVGLNVRVFSANYVDKKMDWQTRESEITIMLSDTLFSGSFM